METVKERLIIFISYLGIGQGKFEKICGLSNGFVTNIKDGFSTPNLNKIMSSQPQLNIEWLITGNGEMLKPQQSGGINNSYGGSFNDSSFVGYNNGNISHIGKNVKGTGNIVGNKIGNVHGNIKGNHNNVGIIPADCEKQLMKAQAEVDYLRKELKSLKEQLKQAVSDKERALGMLEKALNR